ncbi:MAG: phosphomethylpyrimidine synthase ThiC, partial [Candidatus Nitrosocosmicus sp.]
MGTQLSSAKRGIFTDEIKQVAKDEELDIDFITRAIAKGSIIIPNNNERKHSQQHKIIGIGKGLKTKVNVN